MELAASLAISVDTVARPQQEIKRLSEQISAFKKKGASATSGAIVPGGEIMFANIVKRLSKRRCTGENRGTLTRGKIQTEARNQEFVGTNECF